jgi:hypothetical protein
MLGRYAASTADQRARVEHLRLGSATSLAEPLGPARTILPLSALYCRCQQDSAGA